MKIRLINDGKLIFSEECHVNSVTNTHWAENNNKVVHIRRSHGNIEVEFMTFENEESDGQQDEKLQQLLRDFQEKTGGNTK